MSDPSQIYNRQVVKHRKETYILTMQEWQLYQMIPKQRKILVSNLRHDLKISSQHLNNVLRKLMNKGLVERIECGVYRRSV